MGEYQRAVQLSTLSNV